MAQVKEVSICKITKVLIISDRLMEQARVLEQYINNIEEFEVIGLAENKQNALQILKSQTLDYLIIAGYLKDWSNYSIIEHLQSLQYSFHIVHWAILDSLINTICMKYKIPLKFDRTLPLIEFIQFLKEHVNDPISTLIHWEHENIDKNSTYLDVNDASRLDLLIRNVKKYIKEYH